MSMRRSKARAQTRPRKAAQPSRPAPFLRPSPIADLARGFIAYQRRLEFVAATEAFKHPECIMRRPWGEVVVGWPGLQSSAAERLRRFRVRSVRIDHVFVASASFSNEAVYELEDSVTGVLLATRSLWRYTVRKGKIVECEQFLLEVRLFSGSVGDGRERVLRGTDAAKWMATIQRDTDHHEPV
jgi:hypothetical protein